MIQSFCICLILSILLFKTCNSQELKNHIVADPNGIYHVFWEADKENITFQLEVKSKGYVGFGFSPNGGMSGSDVIIGWVLPDGTSFFHDRHALGFYEPLIDSEQNYVLLKAYENETHTILRFTRKINTCDEDNDTVITDDTTRIIYSWHPDDPKNITGLPYHGSDRRGSRNIYLLSPEPAPVEITDDIYLWTIQMPNISIPPQQTTYWCMTFKLPELDGPHDYTGYTVEIDRNNIGLVHHFTVRECRGNLSVFESEIAAHPRGYQCVAEDTLAGPLPCQPPISLWATGSGQRFPKGVGITLGEKYGGPSYFLIQMHYTNNGLKPGIVDSSKVIWYLTKRQQPIQASMLQMYNQHDYTNVIPPNQPKFAVTVFCPPACTANAFPPEGITIFSVGLHTHLIGIQLALRHFRGDKELKTIASDEHYDFNYQNMRALKEPVVVLPGDMLMGICVYNSTGKNQTTTGGFSTYQEMCYFYLSYYPASPLTICIGSPDYNKIYQFFGVDEVGPDRVQVISPAALYNRSFFDIERQYDWASGGEAKLSEMSSIQYEGTKIVQCQHQYKKEMDIKINASFPMNATMYVRPDACDAKKTVKTSTKHPNVGSSYKPTTKTYMKQTKGYY